MDKHFRYAIHSYTTTHHCSNEATCILSSLSHFGTIKCAVRCCLDYDILALAALVLLVVRSFCALDLHHQDIFSFSHVDPLTLAWSILCFFVCVSLPFTRMLRLHLLFHGWTRKIMARTGKAGKLFLLGNLFARTDAPISCVACSTHARGALTFPTDDSRSA
jgi:hypothetical protein